MIKFAFDIDGCVANLLPIILSTIYDLFNVKIEETELHSFDIEEVSELSGDQVHRAVSDAIQKVNQIKPIEASIEFIKYYHQKTNDTVTFVTARGMHDYAATEEWLNKYFGDIPYAIVMSKNKGEVCERMKIDYFVEDQMKYAEKIANTGTIVLLFDSSQNKFADDEKNENIIRVKDWKEIYKIFNKLNTGD